MVITQRLSAVTIVAITLLVIQQLSATALLSNKYLYQRALKAVEKKEYNNSLAIMNSIKGQDEWQSRANFLRGKILYNLKNYDRAIDYFKAYQSENSFTQHYAIYYLAQNYEALQELEKAAVQYETLIQADDNDFLTAKSMFRLAEIKLRLNEVNTALGLYQMILQKYPNQSVAADVYAQIAEIASDPAEAYKAYYQIIRLFPDSKYIDRARAQVCEIQQTHKLQPPKLSAIELFAYADRLFKLGDYSGAAEQYLPIYKANPQYRLADDALLKLAICEFYLRRYQNAEGHFQLLVKQYHNSEFVPQAMYWQGLTQQKLKSSRKFMATLERLMNRFPDNSWAIKAEWEVAKYHEEAGDYSQAKAAYIRLAKNHPQSTYADDAIWRIGWQAYQKKNYSEAYEVWKIAVNLGAGGDCSDKSCYWAGLMAEKFGEKANAESLYQHVWETYPYSYYAFRLMERFDLQRPLAKFNVASFDSKDFTHKEAVANAKELILLSLWSDAEDLIGFYLRDTNNAEEQQGARIMLAKCLNEAGRADRSIRLVSAEFDSYAKRNKLDEMPVEIWQMNYPMGYQEEVMEFAGKNELDPFLVFALMREESRFKSEALSWAKAHGLMQIIPSTGQFIAKKLGMNDFQTEKLYNPYINVYMGTWYLKSLLNMFSDNKYFALAGYNGGPGNVTKWNKRNPESCMDEFVEAIPVTETREYVKKVLKSYWAYKILYRQENLPGVLMAQVGG